jgi:phosphoglycerol transferase MdoB-like AlkP superfamily enzyme
MRIIGKMHGWTGILFAWLRSLVALSYVWLVAILMNQHIIFFSIAPSLELFGCLLRIGLVFLPQILFILTTILLSLLILQRFKTRRSFLQLLWLCCVSVLWTERNPFNNKVKSIPKLMDKVKVSTYWWLKSQNVNFSFNHVLWLKQSFACLGLD